MNADEDRARGDLVVRGDASFSGTFEERLAVFSASGFSSVSIAPSATTPVLQGAGRSGKERKGDDER